MSKQSELVEASQNISFASDGEVGITVGANERLNIDASGRVTMPYQPAFKAWVWKGSAGNANIADYPILPYSVANFDTTNSFNTTTYAFTAPSAGKYFFSYSLSFNADGTRQRRSIGLHINGVVHEYCDFETTNDYDLVELATIVNLAANDVVDVRRMSYRAADMFWAGAAQSSPVGAFKGYLLG